MAVSWGTLEVVELHAPERPLLRTRSLKEAAAHCARHPERGVIGRLDGVRRFLPIANPLFREQHRLGALR